jgi:hypothetical protein
MPEPLLRLLDPAGLVHPGSERVTETVHREVRLVPVAAAAGFLVAAALASGAREDAFRAGYRAGLQAASLALTKIAGGLSVAEDGQQEERVP